jgi:hypothetical protein
LTCAVAPDGDVYVGGLRDSGWGGANNTGEIVRLRPRWEELPAGIAEVRAAPRGFRIAFTRAVDPRRARQVSSYAVSSYRRVSTPDYGGPDVDRRTDKVVSVAVDSEARVAVIELAQLRAGCVYELRVSDLAPDGARFHPAEAYYTLGRIPADEP